MYNTLVLNVLSQYSSKIRKSEMSPAPSLNFRAQERAMLGGGVYTTSEVASILGVSKSHTYYWFRRYARDLLEKTTGHRYYFGDGRNYVNFKSLIQFSVFIKLRKKGIKTPKIIEAYKSLATFYNDPYPFTREELYVWGSDVLFEHVDQMVTADYSRQHIIDEVFRAHCDRF